MSPSFQTAKIISNTNLAGNYYQLICQPQEPLNFIPGQYLILKINEDRVSQYSLASTPEQTNFELLVDVTPDGVSSKYVKNLKVSDEITYMKPMGKFTIQEITPQVVFLATGSGIAPFKSMIPTLVESSPNTKIKLLFGLRHTTDLIYQDYFQNLQAHHPYFSCSYCLSQPNDQWSGLKGHITQHLETIKDLAESSFYLCGSPDMIEEAHSKLINSQVPEDKIYFEKYW